MLKQTILATAIASATFTFAAPQATSIPADTDIVFVAHNLQNDNKLANTAWRTAFQTMGLEIESIEKDMMDEIFSNPNATALCKALEIDMDTKAHPFESLTLAARLPSSEDEEDFSFVITLETIKTLDVDAIATAINGLIDIADKDHEEARFIKDGTWYTLKEDEGSIAFGPYKNGLRFVGAATVLNRFDALKQDTFTAITATSPLMQALVAPNTYASCKVTIADLSALVDRYVKISDNDRQQLMAMAPMLFTTKALTATFFTEDVNYIISVAGNYATEDDAQTTANILQSYRFMATMGLASEFAADSALMKTINNIAFEAKDKTATVKVVLNPDEIMKAFTEIQEKISQSMMMIEQEPATYTFEEEDFMDFDDAEELSEEEAEAILKEMMKQN